MRLLIATLALALTMANAYAQDAGSSGMGGGGGHKGHRQQSSDKTDAQKPKADEKAYRDALKSVPDKPYDPWQGTR
jgi:Spy/CpxP family protein refolding chaperone